MTKRLSIIIVFLITFSATVFAQMPSPSPSLKGYGLSIFKVESGLYPFVQAYIRTFDENLNPLVNLNELNIGLMVKGRVYDVSKRQYVIQSIRNRQEAVRSILVMDTSGTMSGAPFESALSAAARFIDAKRPQDQVAIIALSDNKDGYELVSNFERDPSALGRRLADVVATNKVTRLYDAVAAAMLLSGGVGAGGETTNDASYIASTSIILFSDGKDEGSAITRSDLMTRITSLEIPIPIYSLSYTNTSIEFLKNMQALSKNTFGKFYDIGEAYETMTQTVESIQDIIQNDYVLTFRSYLPVDGEEHKLKIGVEYPARSGKMRYTNSAFESISPPNFKGILEAQERLDQAIPALPDSNPYMKNPYADAIAAEVSKDVENISQ